MKGFRQQVFNGFVWMGGQSLVIKAFGFIKTVILARILLPSDFGEFGVTLLALSFLETFSETGFNQALIQKSRDIEGDLPSAQLVNFSRGVLISLLLIVLTPFVATFFREDVRRLMYAIAFVPLVRGMINPAVVMMQRKLQFKRKFIFHTVASSFELIVGVISALVFKSAWALVLAILAGASAETLLSFYMLPVPKGRPIFSRIKRLFSFGRWMTGSSILTYLTDQGDDLVVGKFLSARSLGLYQTAFRFGMLPTTQVAGTVSQVALPILSRLPAKKRLIKTMVLARATGYLSFFFGGLLFLYTREFVSLVLGEQWLEIVVTLKIIALFGMVRSIGSVLGHYFISQGKPQINTALNFFKLLLMALLILPGIKLLGLEGVASAVMFSVMASNYLAFFLLAKESEENQVLQDVFKPIAVFIITSLFIMATKPLMGLYSLGVYLASFLISALLIDKHLVDLAEQEVIPRLPGFLRDGYVQNKILISKRGWFEKDWRTRHKKASLSEWQRIYDLKWEHETKDATSLDDIEWIAKQCKKVKAKTVMDVGSGTGKLAVVLAKRGYEVIAVDVSQKAIQLGKKKAEKQKVAGKIKWVQARLENLPLDDGLVDVCVASHVLEHVSDLKKAVEEMKRVAKKAIAIIVPVEKKTRVVANYHLHFFSTESQVAKVIGLTSYETEKISPQRKNGFYGAEIIRYWGQK